MEDIQTAICAIRGNIVFLTSVLNNTDHISFTFANMASDTLFSSAQDLITAARTLLDTVHRGMQTVQDGAYSLCDTLPSHVAPQFDGITAYTHEHKPLIKQSAPMPQDPFMHHAACSPEAQPSHLVDRVCSREPFINAIVCNQISLYLCC
jgi:hypothetical protein